MQVSRSTSADFVYDSLSTIVEDNSINEKRKDWHTSKLSSNRKILKMSTNKSSDKIKTQQLNSRNMFPLLCCYKIKTPPPCHANIRLLKSTYSQGGNEF